jgi:DNA-binding LacI/PurR family transcriptional regulator
MVGASESASVAPAGPGGAPRVRMRDVARLAGVSHQTVSRVLNDHPKVARETRERVAEAIRQLDYRPSSSARALTTGRSRTLGVIMFGVTDYGPAVTLQSISQAAESAGYFLNTVVLRALDRRTIVHAIDRLTGQGVDGLITIAPQTSLGRALQGMPHRVPMIALDDSLDVSVPVVAPDEFGGASKAVEYLLQLGHRTVWHVAGPQDWIAAQERLRGWRETLSGAGAPVHQPASGDWSAASGYQAGQVLARDPKVTAIFAANDQMAQGALLALHEAGRRIPEDVSVVGFDGTPDSAYLVPPLTSVRPDFAEAGRRCLALMLDLLESGPGPRARTIVPTDLVVRSSSAPPPQG